MELQAVKQRFGIIGNAPLLNAALQTAVKVAPTDMNVLIQGESGVIQGQAQQHHQILLPQDELGIGG